MKSPRIERLKKFLVSGWPIIVSALLLFGLGIGLAPISFPNLDPLWRAYLLMVSIFIVILFLSYLPVLIYISFNLKVQERAKSRSLAEIERYRMKELGLIKEFEDNFSSAYEQANYTVPLILATISLLAGWVLFFFHQGPEVLESVGKNGIINDFLNTIAGAHIALYGFLGAYFYTLGVLYHRYITADLTPSVFLHIGTRIWIAIILSIMLSVVFPEQGWLPAAAFTAGIFPNSILNLITQTSKNILPVSRANFIDLRLVRGIGIWKQSRLQEEDIDCVQNLATADLEGLIINTRLGVLCLVHWIDQAVLIMHIGKEDVRTFHKAGIVTATDFHWAYFPNRQSSDTQEHPVPFPLPPGELCNALQVKAGNKQRGEPITPERLQSMMISIVSDYNFLRVEDFHAKCHRERCGTSVAVA